MNVTATALQFGLSSGNPLVQILALVVAVGIVVLVGRVVLKIAWRLVTIAAVVIGLLLLASMLLPQVL
ncbi:hypothetical protein [Salinigranum salinum]|uniref:hypothetical protein n=1 Tax=Salinigranum salinum TaxID=1364937 RepID=UPI0012609A88|nr:hypothetical protein [Salinigranum salinum]